MVSPGNLWKSQQGYNLVEVMITLGVLIIVAQAFALFIRNMGFQTKAFKERVFATSKAIQMLGELKAVVGQGEKGNSISVLDNYDDNGAYKYTLTTQNQVTNSGADWATANTFLSANPSLPGKGYQFVRNITVLKAADDPSVRRVWVRVYYASSNPGAASASTPTAQSPNQPPLAEVFGLVKSVGSAKAPTEVLDIYLIALESVPGWWVRTAALRDLMNAALIDIQARNPGLELRVHWIKRMSFGRDLEYLPEINSALDATAYHYQKTYIYPGQITYDSGYTNPPLYYDPTWFNAKINVDGAVQDPLVNGGYGNSYPIADQFNHAMRYQDELNLYNLYSSLPVNMVPEISLRMLLEGLNNTTTAIHQTLLNSIIVNLHGEMLPVPPLRNISDAAKDPALMASEFNNKPYRAVTHPEKLRFNTSVENAALRVYAYEMNAAGATEGDNIDTVTLFLPGLSLYNLSQVQRLQGSSTTEYKWYSFNYTTNTTSTTPGVSWTSEGTTYLADNYTDANGRSGLRIQLYGVSTTARQYLGPVY